MHISYTSFLLFYSASGKAEMDPRLCNGEYFHLILLSSFVILQLIMILIFFQTVEEEVYEAHKVIGLIQFHGCD